VGDLFARLSNGDRNRSRWDVRELYYQLAKKNWEFNVGVKKIYWGVAESVHLVDVINLPVFFFFFCLIIVSGHYPAVRGVFCFSKVLIISTHSTKAILGPFSPGLRLGTACSSVFLISEPPICTTPTGSF